jgi:hypothetical protein
MLSRLQRVLDAQAARGGHAARERIDLLLDRDSPFLELSPLAEGDAVVGIGVVAAAACVVASADTEPVDRLDPKVRRATALAGDCDLPLVILDDITGDPETVRRHRQHVRWQRARPRGAATAAEPPVPDADGLLDVPGPREIMRHVVDGSRIDEIDPVADPRACRGWATIGGMPMTVVAGEALAAALPAPSAGHPDTGPPDAGTAPHRPAVAARGAGLPVLRVSVTDVPGSAPLVSLSITAGRSGFTFSWPGPGAPATTGDDGVIDPRDTRTVVGIARWCLETC